MDIHMISIIRGQPDMIYNENTLTRYFPSRILEHHTHTHCLWYKMICCFIDGLYRSVSYRGYLQYRDIVWWQNLSIVTSLVFNISLSIKPKKKLKRNNFGQNFLQEKYSRVLEIQWGSVMYRSMLSEVTTSRVKARVQFQVKSGKRPVF